MKVGKGSVIYSTAKVLTEGRDISIGHNCSIGDFAFVTPRKLIMKDGSQIGPHAILSGGGSIYLGKFSTVGFGAMLLPATDTIESQFMCEAAPDENRKVIRGSITLGEGAYIGSGAVVCVSKKCPHIEIGNYSVVGALSYIDKSITPNTIIYPKIKYIIKKRF